ncbi:hypothetical protein GCM10025777_01760 [Membranihabitans marinus]
MISRHLSKTPLQRKLNLYLVVDSNSCIMNVIRIRPKLNLYDLRFMMMEKILKIFGVRRGYD